MHQVVGGGGGWDRERKGGKQGQCQAWWVGGGGNWGEGREGRAGHSEGVYKEPATGKGGGAGGVTRRGR
jgi:hypothetical protein